MCYSAMVLQNAKKAGLKYYARVQHDMYYGLFKRRLEGEKLYLNKALEHQFTVEGTSEKEKEIALLIIKWHEQQIPIIEEELFKQSKRLGDAERALLAKATKKAENDKRISTNKIRKLKADLAIHKSLEINSEGEERIYPLHYMSMLCLDDNGEKVIRPVRYLMRPHNKDEKFDVAFNGCYNARFDGLESVPWWKDSLSKRHGIILVKQFYENVEIKKYLEHNSLPASEEIGDNLVLCFKPSDREYMVIPTLWDKWENDGKTLYSAALITDEPAPEVNAAGHDRTPIFLKEEAIDDWLTVGKSPSELRRVLSQRDTPIYEHRVLMAA